jgi:phosphate starvation-inducible protein PhoH and related proteins
MRRFRQLARVLKSEYADKNLRIQRLHCRGESTLEFNRGAVVVTINARLGEAEAISVLMDAVPEAVGVTHVEWSEFESKCNELLASFGVKKKANHMVKARNVSSNSRELVSEFRPRFLNKSQQAAWETLNSSVITVLIGAAGTGKTHLAVQFGVVGVRAKRFEKIIAVRAIVESGRSRLGAIPGSVGEKIAPYMRPIFDILKVLRAKDVECECIPPCHLQGLTLENAVVIVDETQNLTMDEIRLVISRLGRNSVMVFTGDPTQDFERTQDGFGRMTKALESLDGVGVHRFEAVDIVRNGIIASALERLSVA